MPPARNAKKRRVAADAEKPEEAPPTATAASAKEILLQSDEATSNLSSLLDDMESMATAGGESSTAEQLQSLLTDASLSLLTLKSTQRSLCLGVESHLLHDVVASRRAEVGSKTLELQNLVYERNHLRGRVQECRDFHVGQLAKMARDEMSMAGSGGSGDADAADADAAAAAAVDAAATTTGHVDREKEDEQMINAFLAGGADGTRTKKKKKATKPHASSSFDHRDPSNHAATLSHLKAELTLRRTKEAELTKARSELEQLRKQCASRKAFLGTLPRKLREVERSTGPLQNFFREAVGVVSSSSSGAGGGSRAKNKNKNNKDDVQPTLLIGTDRSARIEAARTLPEPLYTVFWQLTGYVDAFGIRDSGGDTSPAKMLKVDVLEENGNTAEDGTNGPEGWIVRHPKAVALTIPAPDIEGLPPSSSGGPVTIKFRYLPRLGLVTAATASSTNGDGRALLAGLFPNDDGTTLPSCAAPFLLGEDAADMLSQVEEALQKRGDLPYGWCQYVAGLIFPPQSDAGNGTREDEGFDDDDEGAGGHYHDDADGEARYSHHYHHHHESYPIDQAPTTKRGAIEPSTRSVVRSLNRRIRARATLGALLNTLGRSKAPPVHSALDDKSSNGGEETSSTASRLTSWKECTGTVKSCKYFSVSIKRGSDGSLVQATVKIDPAYPAIPPLWSLQDATTTEGAYDPEIGAIEEGINADLSALVVDGVEETYDWILSAQVARLLECLDRPSSGEDNVGAKKSTASYDLYSKGL